MTRNVQFHVHTYTNTSIPFTTISNYTKQFQKSQENTENTKGTSNMFDRYYSPLNILIKDIFVQKNK